MFPGDRNIGRWCQNSSPWVAGGFLCAYQIITNCLYRIELASCATCRLEPDHDFDGPAFLWRKVPGELGSLLCGHHRFWRGAGLCDALNKAQVDILL